MYLQISTEDNLVREVFTPPWPVNGRSGRTDHADCPIVHCMPSPDTPQTAGLARRLAALAYDSVILLGLTFFLTLILVLARGGRAIPPGSWWFGLTLMGAGFAFFTWSWTHGGQTIGARAWSLRVESSDGATLGWKHAVLRFLAAWLLLLPPGLGLLWAQWDKDRLGWHDRLSGTRVVYKPRRR